MVTGKELGGLLFGIHQHDSKGIIYRENDIVRLFLRLGFPEPEWGEVIDMDKFSIREGRYKMYMALKEEFEGEKAY